MHDFISKMSRTEFPDDATDIIDVITRSPRIENHSYQTIMSEYKFVDTVTTPLNECLIFRKYSIFLNKNGSFSVKTTRKVLINSYNSFVICSFKLDNSYTKLIVLGNWFWQWSVRSSCKWSITKSVMRTELLMGWDGIIPSHQEFWTRNR